MAKVSNKITVSGTVTYDTDEPDDLKTIDVMQDYKNSADQFETAVYELRESSSDLKVTVEEL